LIRALFNFIFSLIKTEIMKNSISSAWRSGKKVFGIHHGFANMATLFFCSTILTGVLFSSCQKQAFETQGNDPLNTSNAKQASGNNTEARKDGNILDMYSGLSDKTLWELQQARAATARYLDLKNAIKDGYSNINVDVPNMGHHFMNPSLVDATLDVRHPEILVYNGLETGNPELVAVEYAVPLNLPMPEGFTGSDDVWNGASGFPLWLQHAWVWKYNPDGVFNGTNPTVDLD
jgi:hypothetical protein